MVNALRPDLESVEKMDASTRAGDCGTHDDGQLAGDHGCGVIAMIVSTGTRLLPSTSSGP